MSQPLATGSILKQRYRIERELGRGGIGVVYLARDERLHQMPVVIKFLLDASGQNAWLTKKFQHEAEALTRINHPNVVRVIDRDEAEDGRPFFVMEFIDGQPMRGVMSPAGPAGPIGMQLRQAAHLVRQIGHALRAAHEQGVFHRDLKPENIMLQTLGGGQEQVKLIDFGIAKLLDSQSGAATEVAVIAGSQAYISPEQLLSQPITAATDIYTLAIIAYEMLTGRLPFQVSAPNSFLATQQLVKLQQSHAFMKPKLLRPDLPEAAEALLLNALQFDAARRPQNAQIFAEDLAAALEGQIRFEPVRPTAVPSLLRTDAIPPAVVTAPDGTESYARPEPPPQSTEVISPVSATASTQSPPAIAQAPGNETKEKGIGKAAYAGAALLAIVAAVIGWRMLRGNEESKPIPPAVAAASAGSDLSLHYSVTMQKDPRRYPGSKPFQLPGEVVFSPGDRVRFTFGGPQAGHLYILNESPSDQGTESSFNILFPSPTSNQGSSQLAAGQQVAIPAIGDGFELDEESGAEKLWLVWSLKPIESLESLKRWANAQDLGEIKDAAQIASLRAFLNASASLAPYSQTDDAAKQTTLKLRGDTMVKLVKLEHH